MAEAVVPRAAVDPAVLAVVEGVAHRAEREAERAEVVLVGVPGPALPYRQRDAGRQAAQQLVL